MVQRPDEVGRDEPADRDVAGEVDVVRHGPGADLGDRLVLVVEGRHAHVDVVLGVVLLELLVHTRGDVVGVVVEPERGAALRRQFVNDPFVVLRDRPRDRMRRRREREAPGRRCADARRPGARLEQRPGARYAPREQGGAMEELAAARCRAASAAERTRWASFGIQPPTGPFWAACRGPDSCLD